MSVDRSVVLVTPTPPSGGRRSRPPGCHFLVLLFRESVWGACEENPDNFFGSKDSKAHLATEYWQPRYHRLETHRQQSTVPVWEGIVSGFDCSYPAIPVWAGIEYTSRLPQICDRSARCCLLEHVHGDLLILCIMYYIRNSPSCYNVTTYQYLQAHAFSAFQSFA
jgi:hypothetical protein